MTPKSITPATVPDITGASHTSALVGSSKKSYDEVLLMRAIIL